MQKIILEVGPDQPHYSSGAQALRVCLVAGNISTFDDLVEAINIVSRDSEGVDLL